EPPAGAFDGWGAHARQPADSRSQCSVNPIPPSSRRQERSSEQLREMSFGHRKYFRLPADAGRVGINLARGETDATLANDRWRRVRRLDERAAIFDHIDVSAPQRSTRRLKVFANRCAIRGATHARTAACDQTRR